jgi:hypothetical protein
VIINQKERQETMETKEKYFERIKTLLGKSDLEKIRLKELGVEDANLNRIWSVCNLMFYQPEYFTPQELNKHITKAEDDWHLYFQRGRVYKQ